MIQLLALQPEQDDQVPAMMLANRRTSTDHYAHQVESTSRKNIATAIRQSRRP